MTIENQYSGVLQIAKCCTLQKKIDVLVCCKSPSAVDYNRNQYSGVLQIAKCCKFPWRGDGALCRQSSVNSIFDREATDVPLVFPCFALVFFDFPLFSFGVEVFSVGPL